MRKIFSALVLFGMLFALSVCSAQEVRISDYGVDNFVSRYNTVANDPSVEYKLALKEQPENLGRSEVDGQTYDVYMVGCGDAKTSGVFMNLMVTPDGYISKILIFAVGSIDKAYENAGVVSGLALIGAGMSPEEFEDFATKLTDKQDLNFRYWSASMNKYVVYETNPSNPELVCITLSAETK